MGMIWLYIKTLVKSKMIGELVMMMLIFKLILVSKHI